MGWRLVWFCQCLSGKHFRLCAAPLAWIMGVDWSDANLAGSLLGRNWRLMSLLLISISRPISNERHAGCQDHCHYLVRPLWFANFGSIGVVVGAFSAISPNARRKSPSLVYGRWRRRRFPTDERDHCRVLYWFSLSFIAGVRLIKRCIRQSHYCQ